jgi:type I restriction enzyme S subunit
LSVEIRIPSTKIIRHFNELVAAQFNKINKNKSQIETITKLRDTLLPKLMSGEVRVKYDKETTA